MRRSSGRLPATAVASVAAAVLLAATSSPVLAGGPGSVLVGGGDDPAIAVAPSADELATNRWKLELAAQLRGAAATQIGARSGGTRLGIRPQLVAPPCSWDCPPVTFNLDSWARQQITWYYCGPAAAQVIINQTRDVVSSSTSGQKTSTNFRTQSVIGSFMGTNDSIGTSAYMLRSGLNEFADLDTGGGPVTFTVADLSSGSDFHWAMIEATWIFHRGAAVPVQMTFSSQHLVSWPSSWWNRNPGAVVRHWVSVRGYSGFWDGTYSPTLDYTDSAGGYGGQTGNFVTASRLLYNLNQANSGRIVY